MTSVGGFLNFKFNVFIFIKAVPRSFRFYSPLNLTPDSAVLSFNFNYVKIVDGIDFMFHDRRTVKGGC